ncbi:MAG: phosphoglycerate mutase family protein [Roseiflexaceae bacterium]
MVHEIYILRHAAPDRGSSVPYNIPPGPPLTNVGRKEALQAGLFLQTREIDAVYVSPFMRTRQTALIVSEHMTAPFAYVESIKEGAPGELHRDIRARVRGLLDEISQREVGRVMLVTHGCCVLATLQETTNDTIDLSGHKYDYGNHSPTAGIWHGVRQESGLYVWELVFTPTVVS